MSMNYQAAKKRGLAPKGSKPKKHSKPAKRPVKY
jgi:hypothetical protein